jgi:hypothetical protein
MANPNIVAVTTIFANNSSYLISSDADPFADALVNNPASSGKIFKVNTIIVSNVDTVNSNAVTVSVFPQDDLGGTGRQIVSNVSIPANTTLVIVEKNTSIYLKEDQSVGITAGASNTLVATTSWEEIN